jgi:Leucine-rich repeat (LRR) protein
LPAEIGKLVNLQNLYLYNNSLSSLPAEIGKLVNLKYLSLKNNQLSSLPDEILKIKNVISIDETSYDINNINMENEILIFSDLKIKLSNLPINTKEIWLNKNIINYEIKTPFNCVINFF